jgi:hypothetical protein
MLYKETLNSGRPQRTGVLPVLDLDFQSVSLCLPEAYAIRRGGREDECAGHGAEVGTKATTREADYGKQSRIAIAGDTLALVGAQMVPDEGTYHHRTCLVLVLARPGEYDQSRFLLAV